MTGMIVHKFLNEFILTVRKLWQRELITLEELDEYAGSALKLRKELLRLTKLYIKVIKDKELE